MQTFYHDLPFAAKKLFKLSWNERRWTDGKAFEQTRVNKFVETGKIEDIKAIL